MLDFDTLERYAEKAESGPCPISASEMAEVFGRSLREVDVVSFDIFDTALLRYVDHPLDVFLHLGRQAAFQAFDFSRPISVLRAAAEEKARAMVAGLIGSTEVNLLEIYQVFCDLNGLDRAHAESFVEAEQEAELRLCFACAPILALYRNACSSGKQVIFVSDTYHERSFLQQLLRSAGYEAQSSDIYASSESRRSKQSGALFPEVLAALQTPAERVLHLGDHPVSDLQRASDVGIRALLHPWKTSRSKPALQSARNGPQAANQEEILAQYSVVRGMIHAGTQRAGEMGRGDDFWWKFGYRAVGPLTVGFAQWLREQLARDGAEHVYFLLRDGALLHQVYQALYGRGDACPASTLLSSRRAMLLPVLESAPEFATMSLFGGIGRRPVREFVERLHVSASSFAAEARAAGFLSLDEPVNVQNDHRRLLRFFLQPRVERAIRERSRLERTHLENYLRQALLYTRKKAALVDLGWNGTIHKALHILCRNQFPDLELTGYYLATGMEAAHNVVPGLQVRSYLAHHGEPQPVYKTIQSFLNLFEFVFSSPEGSLLYFEPNGSGQARPVQQPPDRPIKQSQHIATIHEGALTFAADFQTSAASCCFPAMPSSLAAEAVFCTILQPTGEEASLLGRIEHCDNLGSHSKHVAARLPGPGAGPAELLEAFHAAHWKAGLLAQPNAQTAALRTLLWLRSLREQAI